MPPSTRWCSQEIHARSWPFSSRFFRSLSQAAPDVGAALRDTHTHCHGSTFRQTRNAGGYHVPNGRQSSHVQNKQTPGKHTDARPRGGCWIRGSKGLGAAGGRGPGRRPSPIAHRGQCLLSSSCSINTGWLSPLPSLSAPSAGPRPQGDDAQP